jgi:hypothetical protein
MLKLEQTRTGLQGYNDCHCMYTAAYTSTITAATATGAALCIIQVMHGIGLKSSSNVAGGGERVIVGSCPYAIAQVVIACVSY